MVVYGHSTDLKTVGPGEGGQLYDWREARRPAEQNVSRTSVTSVRISTMGPNDDVVEAIAVDVSGRDADSAIVVFEFAVDLKPVRSVKAGQLDYRGKNAHGALSPILSQT